MVVAPTSSHAQNLGTAADYAVLGGSTVTNTGPSVLVGNLGLSPGSAVTGFPPGIVTPPGTTNVANGPAGQAQSDLTNAYTTLAGVGASGTLLPASVGSNVVGFGTLGPGVYKFASSALVDGTLTLNATAPNSTFIFFVPSALTTASASRIVVVGGGQGTNVFWVVGSSATLGTTTSWVGDILALTSITLNTGANIACGAALARNGAVTLDTNNIAIGNLAPCTTPLIPVSPAALPPALVPVVVALNSVAGSGAVAVPTPFVALATMTPTQLAIRLPQLNGESGTAVPQAGIAAMNMFLSLVSNPFADTRGFAPENPTPPRTPLIYKAAVYKAQAEAPPDPSRWGIWAAGYGGQSTTTGNSVIGTHDRSARTLGYAMGLDYRVTPYTTVGLAFASGTTHFGVSDGFGGVLGGGRSEMFQSALYSMTRVNAAYVSATLAYAWHRVSTDRVLTVVGTDDLTAAFSANNFAGRIEGGYRFAIPVFGVPGFGFTPYSAFQMQAFRTPSYNEIAASGTAAFALAYSANTTTTNRTELGAWFDDSVALGNGASLALRSRAAWAHDHWSDPTIGAAFQALPGSNFTVIGTTPVRDSLLASAGAEIRFKNISLAGDFNSELTQHGRTYSGTGRLRYTW